MSGQKEHYTGKIILADGTVDGGFRNKIEAMNAECERRGLGINVFVSVNSRAVIVEGGQPEQTALMVEMLERRFEGSTLTVPLRCELF